MRQRLRPAHSSRRLAELYGRPYNCWDRGEDHIERVFATAGLVAGVAHRHGLTTLADLSCGDGMIARYARALAPELELYLGDLVPAEWPNQPLGVVGPIEETLEVCPQVDLFLCSETLEHLDDPERVLVGIRKRSRWLVCSTPLAAWSDPNPEHYWAWDEAELHDMLTHSGWTPRTYATLQPAPDYYRFQLWAAN
jgi:hypothetical protein